MLDGKDSPAKSYFTQFWIRRVARIFPVLWVLLISYCIARFVGKTLDLRVMDLWLLMSPQHPIWTYATFTQSIPMAIAGYEGGGPQWLRPTWSVAIEEQFYLLFPIIVYFNSLRTVTIFAIITILAAPFFGFSPSNILTIMRRTCFFPAGLTVY